MQIKTIIIDDEDLALDLLEDYISKIEVLDLIGRFNDPVKGYNFLLKEKVDLLFIDLNMPQLGGLEFIASLEHRPEIIITTAYREFAVEGFELKVLDYLVKPIPFNRFIQAVHRYLDLHPTHSIAQEDSVKDFISVRADRRNVKIPFSELLYIEGMKDYVKVFTINEKFMVKDSIGTFLKNHKEAPLYRIHKSFAINIAQIKSYSSEDVLIREKSLPIGLTFKSNFESHMKRHWKK